MRIVVLRERESGETRVGLMPDAVKKLVAAKTEVVVESGAGAGASVTDGVYTGAGAQVSPTRSAIVRASSRTWSAACVARSNQE